MSYESEDKMVSHPSHYKFGNFEVIDVVDAVTEELSGYECNYTAQALQYLMRWHRKNGDQDLEKAIWFIQRILDKHKEADRETDVKNDETLYSLHQEGEPQGWDTCKTCGDCKHFDSEIGGAFNLGFCTKCKSSCTPSSPACGLWENHDISKPSIDDEPEPLNLRKNAAGVYIPQDKDASKKIKKQLDGSKFGMAYAPDDFMNPPYEELMNKCTKLESDLYKLSGENDAILEDYRTTLNTISNRLSTGSPYSKKDIREWIDKKLEVI